MILTAAQPCIIFRAHHYRSARQFCQIECGQQLVEGCGVAGFYAGPAGEEVEEVGRVGVRWGGDKSVEIEVAVAGTEVGIRGTAVKEKTEE